MKRRRRRSRDDTFRDHASAMGRKGDPAPYKSLRGAYAQKHILFNWWRAYPDYGYGEMYMGGLNQSGSANVKDNPGFGK